jgi:hypothetical protein
MKDMFDGQSPVGGLREGFPSGTTGLPGDIVGKTCGKNICISRYLYTCDCMFILASSVYIYIYIYTKPMCM